MAGQSASKVLQGGMNRIAIPGLLPIRFRGQIILANDESDPKRKRFHSRADKRRVSGQSETFEATS